MRRVSKPWHLYPVGLPGMVNDDRPGRPDRIHFPGLAPHQYPRGYRGYWFEDALDPAVGATVPVFGYGDAVTHDPDEVQHNIGLLPFASG